MTLNVNATDYWGTEVAQSIDIRCSQDAERALSKLYQYIPVALRTTVKTAVTNAIGTSLRRANLPDVELFSIRPAEEKSNEDCGSGPWWLDHANLYLTDGGIVSLRARGSWANYGHPSGTRYHYDGGSIERVKVTPDNWEHAINAIRSAVSPQAHRRTGKKDPCGTGSR